MAAPLNASDVDRYLRALFSHASSDAYVEIRFRTETGMGRAFYGLAHLVDAETMIARLAPATDVYVGVLPRNRQASGRDAVVPHGQVVWTDCDSPQSVAALDSFVPEPSILLASGGSDENRHAYWLLRERVAIDTIERANRRMASRLGADTSCADAARILRPPSLNHKYAPPTAVRLIRCDSARRYALDDIVDVSRDDAPSRDPRTRREEARIDADPLLRIDPTRYVEALCGVRVGRDHKISCPFHADDKPSLHVYQDPARGWWCFGCNRGGSIIDFAALVFLTTTRGSDFVELRRRLTDIFVPEHAEGRRS